MTIVHSDSNNVTINNITELFSDISVLFLNQKFSDIAIVVADHKFYAHKVILAARSKHFEDLLYQNSQSTTQNEIAITGTTPAAVKLLLKYFYTGEITIDPDEMDVTLEVTSLANEYGPNKLEDSLKNELKTMLNLKNVYDILNMASLYNLEELKESCFQLLDARTTELLANNEFEKLSQTSIVEILQRDTFGLPEIEIFNIVSKWRKINDDIDDLVLNCVRLSCLSVVEMVSVVWPSNMINCEKIINAIAEIVEVKPKSTKCRAQAIMDVNFATPDFNCEVISGESTSFLLTGNRNIEKYAKTIIGDINGFTFKFNKPYTINHIHMMLWDGDLRYYCYYIEVSADAKNWKKVLDYSAYPCRSDQHLYFPAEIIRYVRLVGTKNTQNNEFHLVFFEAYYRKTIPKLINNVICPTSNVALLDKKAAVVEGSLPNFLIDGNYTNFNGNTGFTHHLIGAGSIIVQLAQPYIISNLKLLLWDQDSRFYKYYIETSTNKINWEMAVDRRNEECKSWQQATFAERPVVFIKITGTHNSSNNAFHCVHIECPINPA